MSKLLLKEDASRLMASVDNFLFDCDGVLWNANGKIEGSLDTILKLKQLGKRVYYVTNNSSKTRVEYLEKCQNWGFPADQEDIVCTAYMAAQYLKMKGFVGKVYLVGKEESLGVELQNAGIPYTGHGPDTSREDVVTFEDCLKCQLDPEINCVMVGFDPHISYMKIMKACSYLKKPDCLFIATNEDPSLPTPGPILIPGTGTMVAPIKLAAEREPTVMGKPEVSMFEVLQRLHHLDPSRSMMVGDRLETDIAFAKKCGMKSLSVLSGHCSKQDVLSNKDRIVPDFYVDCLGSLGNYLE